MAQYVGNNSNNSWNLAGTTPGAGATANSILCYDGNDTLYGSSYPDYAYGGAGNDYLSGAGGNDVLDGDGGADNLFGGDGTDFLIGNDGNDTLSGGAGNDSLRGNFGDDRYVHYAGDGVDYINDDLNETGGTGSGGGNDTVYLGFNMDDLAYAQPAGTYDLWLGTATDIFSDGILNDGVIIQNFFANLSNQIEYLQSADNQIFYLWTL